MKILGADWLSGYDHVLSLNRINFVFIKFKESFIFQIQGKFYEEIDKLSEWLISHSDNLSISSFKILVE